MSNAYNRIQWLHEQIRALRYPNAQRLCERFSISRRQGQRDIHFLREELGAPLHYSAERRGFCYTGDFSLPIYYKNANEGDYTEFLDAQTRLIEHQIDEENGHPRYVQLQIPFTVTEEEKFVEGILRGRTFRVRYTVLQYLYDRGQLAEYARYAYGETMKYMPSGRA